MNQGLPKLSIFVSSPGDVGAERAVAVAVVERLQLEFRGSVELAPYLWEHSVLRATETFQAQIVDVQKADLALFILWSRVGTPLPLAQFARADGTQYRSGTDYEYERALESFARDKRPEILCYLKTASVRLSLKDREDRARRNAELDDVSEFVDRWFKNADGTFKAAFYSFEKTAQFEDLIEIHLRDWIRERLRKISGRLDGPRPAWTGSPFRGLQAFDFEHAHIYCGRTAMVSELLEAMRRRSQEGRPFLMVTGMSGVGKSSLVRAGLLPLMTRRGVIEGVIGWRRAVFKPNVSHQTLLEGFAAALVAADALPGLGSAKTVEDLLIVPDALTTAVGQALVEETARASDEGPDPDAVGAVRLVVLIDQFEEIFDETVAAADRIAFVEALRVLAVSGHAWVIATLRADFFSRTAELPERFRDLFIDRGGLFTVGGPRSAEIAQMIRRPAAMAGLEFERRGDQSEESLDDVLRDAVAGNPTILPLLEFTLDELWRRSAGSGVLRFADYEQIGGLHGALRLRADEEFAKLPPAVQASLPQVLAAIVHTDPTDERRILQNRVSTARFDDQPACRRLIEAFTEAHLLVGDVATDGTPVVALAHEALLREWPPAVRWISANREMLALRAGISAASALWRNSEEREGRLLSGELLADAASLAKDGASALTSTERDFIRKSQRAQRAYRIARVRDGVAAFTVMFLIMMIPVIGLDQLSRWARLAWAVPRVYGAERLPVSREVRSSLQASIERLSALLRLELELRPESGPWSTAQIRIALRGLPEIGPEPPDFRDYATETEERSCRCWRETPLKPPNEVATAWVISALAILGVPATPEQIEALLSRQNPDGWWPIYLSAPVPQNASTVATALELLSLKRHLDRGYVEPEQRERVTAAIAKAAGWLQRLVPEGSARWTPYPPPPVGLYDDGDYMATSGLVLHVLQTVTGASPFGPAWLRSLPDAVPHVRSNEISKASVLIAESGRRRLAEIDDSRMYRFPWMLLATVDAAGSGNALERARALVWVEEALRDPLGEEDFASETWIVAEVLLVLRQVEAIIEGRSSPFDGPGQAIQAAGPVPARSP